jgi:hypothetical protein
LKKLLYILSFFLICISVFAGSGPVAETPVIIIGGGENDLQITLYPNPFRSNLEINFSSKSDVSSIEVRFLNLIGKEMDVKFNLPVNSMSEHFDLDLKQLSSGVYFMEITAKQANGGISKYTRKVTKL